MTDDTPNTLAAPAKPSENKDTPPPSPPPAVGQDEKSAVREEIRDPEAWARSLKEKYERLSKKEEDARKALESQLETLQKNQQEVMQKQFDALRDELKTAKDQAEAATLEALRVKAVVAAGLPDTAAKFIKATDANSIEAEVKELVELAPKAARPKGRMGNAGKTTNTYDPTFIQSHFRGTKEGGPFRRKED